MLIYKNNICVIYYGHFLFVCILQGCLKELFFVRINEKCKRQLILIEITLKDDILISLLTFCFTSKKITIVLIISA